MVKIPFKLICFSSTLKYQIETVENYLRKFLRLEKMLFILNSWTRSFYKSIYIFHVFNAFFAQWMHRYFSKLNKQFAFFA